MATMDDQDKRTERPSVPLSPAVMAQVEQAAVTAGLNRGQWLREAVHEKLARELGIDVEDLDTARRPEPRRRNHSERAAADGNAKEQQR